MIDSRTTHPDRPRIHCWIAPDLYDRLRRTAFESGQSQKAIIEAALDAWLAAHPWPSQNAEKESDFRGGS